MLHNVSHYSIGIHLFVLPYDILLLIELY